MKALIQTEDRARANEFLSLMETEVTAGKKGDEDQRSVKPFKPNSI